uniref:GATA-type domain-containing protein n=1 Tax=Populus alba TaxID=43335 RepID=A0A4U5Q5J8_POPAL|nr:hypothetical protein D5086_0000148610 [Populus alba]
MDSQRFHQATGLNGCHHDKSDARNLVDLTLKLGLGNHAGRSHRINLIDLFNTPAPMTAPDLANFNFNAGSNTSANKGINFGPTNGAQEHVVLNHFGKVNNVIACGGGGGSVAGLNANGIACGGIAYGGRGGSVAGLNAHGIACGGIAYGGGGGSVAGLNANGIASGGIAYDGGGGSVAGLNAHGIACGGIAYGGGGGSVAGLNANGIACGGIAYGGGGGSVAGLNANGIACGGIAYGGGGGSVAGLNANGIACGGVGGSVATETDFGMMVRGDHSQGGQTYKSVARGKGKQHPSNFSNSLNPFWTPSSTLNTHTVLSNVSSRDGQIGSSYGSRRRGPRRSRKICYFDPYKRCTNLNCNTRNTPMWRNGPLGPKSLRKACSIKYKKEEGPRSNH